MPQEKCDDPLWFLVVEFNSLGLHGKYFFTCPTILLAQVFSLLFKGKHIESYIINTILISQPFFYQF